MTDTLFVTIPVRIKFPNTTKEVAETRYRGMESSPLGPLIITLLAVLECLRNRFGSGCNGLALLSGNSPWGALLLCTLCGCFNLFSGHDLTLLSQDKQA